jgi:receptor expression-enhancing protein 5/6
LSHTEKFKELEEKTGYSKVYFFLATFSVLGLVIYFTGGIKLITDLVGFLYPAYMSFKALEGGKNFDGDATQWMTYWIIFCSLTLLESIFPFMVEKIKWYYLIKCLFVIWLYHPKTTGAEVIYSSAVRPYILPLLDGTTAAPKPGGEPVDADLKKDE